LSGYQFSNPVKTIEIGGESVRVGKLTIGMAVDLESYLRTVPSKLESIEASGILKQLSKETADSIVSDALQEHAFYPPDAVTALCDKRFLLNATFGQRLIRAALRAYNPGLTDADIDRIADKAVYPTDTVIIQQICSGASDPKGVAAAVPHDPTSPASESNGGG
jgi:hypothetical protein